MTVRDIIERALRKIQVVQVGDDVPAEDAQEALNALNDMMAGWQLFGVARAHTTLALTDAFPLDDKFAEGTVYMLASRIAPNFDRPINFNEARWMRALQAAYMVITPVTLPTFRRNRADVVQ